MKVYKMEIFVIDFEDHGETEVINAIENERYFTPSVLSSKCVDIGEWEDSNPLNFSTTKAAEIKRLFG